MSVSQIDQIEETAAEAAAPPPNDFLTAPLPATYVKTALPIIFVMGMNGVLAVVDALFLGHYVGPEALAAVTLMFPAYMMVVALATLVSSGMSSLLARHIGAGRRADARAVFAGAHGLALLLGTVLIGLFAIAGRPLTLAAAAGNGELAQMGWVYLRITALFSPLAFVLSVNSDALRNEGRVGFMAAISLLVSMANIGFNFLLIAVFEMGVAGSALGTGAAQVLAFAILLGFRLRGQTMLRPSALWRYGIAGHWRRILQLGAPLSLGFLGLALGSSAVIAALQSVETVHYAATVSAYGIVTRVMTFGYLPLLGLSFAMQTITGNNYGAGKWARSDQSLVISLWVAFAYCAMVQGVLTVFAAPIGARFVEDPEVIAEVARILPVTIGMFFLAGPMVMVAAHFQAIGDAGRAAVLNLSKPYVFAIPLTFGLPLAFGEGGIWLAGPAAELLLLGLTAVVLMRGRRGLRWGVFAQNMKRDMELRP
ncbi:MATE family efflux transporter [Alphaproteobacteria bacterium KMM 3653]|uniref:Multidrug export protein MepA n=1 Tax=Harenicola maris TaxID=2841044 RepID=A0AAP2CN68_9RHOB|nr:MATE family efflux transporter [Harenicola maris]